MKLEHGTRFSFLGVWRLMTSLPHRDIWFVLFLIVIGMCVSFAMAALDLYLRR